MARILIVDDCEGMRNVLASLLRQDGHTCSGADSSRGALDKIRSEHYDIVIIDLIMPDESGIVVLKQCIASQIPHLVFSALDEKTARRYVPPGTPIVPKWLPPDALLASVRRVLEQSRDESLT